MKMIARLALSAALVGIASMIAACSGNNGVTPSTPLSNAGTTALSSPSLSHASKHGKARLVIRIPLKKKLGRRLHPEYISPSTKSMIVAVQGGASQTFDLTSNSKNCGTSATTDYLTCQEGLILPVGQQTLTVTLYDQTGGKGSQLSTATTSVSIAKTGFTPISIVLGGVVKKAAVLIGGSAAATVPIGTPTSVPVTVEAYDADGNLIVPPGNYTSSITVTNADTSSVTSFTPPVASTSRVDRDVMRGFTTQTTVPAVGKTKRPVLRPMDTTTVVGPGSTVTLYYNGNGGGTFQTTLTPSVGSTPQPAGAATMTTTGTPAITEYSIARSTPYGIAPGPDGALWFTVYGGSTASIVSGTCSAASCYYIGRVTTNGALTEYPVQASVVEGCPTCPNPDTLLHPEGITTGSDGALWFASGAPGSGFIGRATTDGTTAGIYDLGGSDYQLGPITSGPDGALWFLGTGSYLIGRITTSGTIKEYTIPAGGLTDITAGPDGALWFTQNGEIGRITTTGTVTEYTILSGDSAPFGITSGPDGALWFTDQCTGAVGRMTTDGTYTEYPLPPSSSPTRITAGPDGALWVVDQGANNIARITTTGTVTGGYPIPTSGSDPAGITTGPDGAIWFTEFSGQKIGRLP